MKLSKKDAELFFDIMWPLQTFVNQKHKIYPKMNTVEKYRDLLPGDKRPVINTLYKHPEIISEFVTVNPYNFSKDKLEIVTSWAHNLVTGTFYIERMLKKHTIFISEDSEVYAVLGLFDDFDEIVDKRRLPFMVKTTLLPFKGCIVYDGTLEGYNMFFGGNITRRMKETYMAAKQNDKIIERLEQSDDRQTAKKQGAETAEPKIKNWKSEFKKMTGIAAPLKGGKDQPAIFTPAFSLVKASLELGQAAASEPDDIDQLWDCYEKTVRALRKVETVLDRAD